MQNDKPEQDTERGFTIVDRRFTNKSEEEKKETLQAEKLKVAAKETAQPKQEKVQERPQAKAQGTLEMTLSSLIFSLSHTALIQMGEIPNPATNEKEKNLSLAKQSIDLVTLLQEKTKGNLTEDEETLFENVLYDLKMRYVQNSR